MERYFVTAADIERYRRLRTAGNELSAKVVETVPQRAYDEVGVALGLGGRVVTRERDLEFMTLIDCCVHDWRLKGRTPMQIHAEKYPPKAESIEDDLLYAFLNARHQVLWVNGIVPAAGVYCVDDEAGTEFFLMDIGMSRSTARNDEFVARVGPAGKFWMATSGMIPIFAKGTMRRALLADAGFSDSELGAAVALPRLYLALDDARSGKIRREKKSSLLRRMPRRR